MDYTYELSVFSNLGVLSRRLIESLFGSKFLYFIEHNNDNNYCFYKIKIKNIVYYSLTKNPSNYQILRACYIAEYLYLAKRQYISTCPYLQDQYYSNSLRQRDCLYVGSYNGYEVFNIFNIRKHDEKRIADIIYDLRLWYDTSNYCYNKMVIQIVTVKHLDRLKINEALQHKDLYTLDPEPYRLFTLKDFPEALKLRI